MHVLVGASIVSCVERGASRVQPLCNLEVARLRSRVYRLLAVLIGGERGPARPCYTSMHMHVASKLAVSSTSAQNWPKFLALDHFS